MSKHVFHITHPLSEALALLYIRKSGLQVDDCICLIARGSIASHFFKSCSIYSVRGLFLDWCGVKRDLQDRTYLLPTNVDHEPEELTSCQLHKLFASMGHYPILFSCSFYPTYLQDLLVHYRLGLVLMEDGIVSNSPSSYSKHCPSLFNSQIGKHDLLCALSVSPTALSDAPRRLFLADIFFDTIGSSYNSVDIVPLCSNNLICGESIRFVKTMQFSVYLQFLCEIVRHLSLVRPGESISFLQHPSYQLELSNEQKACLKKTLDNLNVRICSPEIAPEVEAVESSRTKYTLHGLGTSLLPYYKLYGGSSYCWALKYAKIWPSLSKAFLQNRDSYSAGFFFANVIAPF